MSFCNDNPSLAAPLTAAVPTCCRECSSTQELLRLIQECQLQLIDTDGTQIAISQSLRELLRIILSRVDQQGISWTMEQQQVTTSQAAKMLGTSRPFVTRLLTKGAIPFHAVGSHRRIFVNDLLQYMRSRETGRSHEIVCSRNPDDCVLVSSAQAQPHETIAVEVPRQTAALFTEAMSAMTEWDSLYDQENYDGL